MDSVLTVTGRYGHERDHSEPTATSLWSGPIPSVARLGGGRPWLRWPPTTPKEAIMCGRYVLETDLSIICLMQLWGS